MIFIGSRSLAVDRHDSAPANDYPPDLLKAGVAAAVDSCLAFGLPAWLGDATAAGSSTFAPNASFASAPMVGDSDHAVCREGQGTYTSIRC